MFEPARISKTLFLQNALVCVGEAIPCKAYDGRGAVVVLLGFTVDVAVGHTKSDGLSTTS